jgi:hypothetical protein
MAQLKTTRSSAMTSAQIETSSQTNLPQQQAESAPQQFSYSAWRQGGWYVHNVRHPNGSCGCVSNNYPDKKWRIVCDKRRGSLGEEGDFTFPSRDAAARAEFELVAALKLNLPSPIDVERLQDFVRSHGYGDATAEGIELGKTLIAAGDDYATAGAEIVSRGLTEDAE